MANRRELSVNRRQLQQAKYADRLEPKGAWSEQGLTLSLARTKATQEGRWGKVKALQHLLTRSFSGRALAVRRVTENRGKRTPGVDGVVWDSPEKKIEAVLTLRQRGYQTLHQSLHGPKSRLLPDDLNG